MNFDKLKDFLDYYLPMLGVPGSDTVIYQDHCEIFRHTSGFNSLKNRTPVQRDAIYNIYSCTKIATCVAGLQLIERGEVLATDPIHVYFPEYKSITVANGGEYSDKAKQPILVKHLFSMSSGLRKRERFFSIQSLSTSVNLASKSIICIEIFLLTLNSSE